jgi:hypothetical protein
VNAEERDRLRRESLEAPGWYSPWAHLAAPALFGVGVAAFALSQLHDLKLWQVGFALVIFLLCNATEWRAHRDLLHARFPPLGVLYDRHTPQHHMIFVTDDMAMRSAREFRLVLIPAYGILAIFAVTVPEAIALWWLGQTNLAALFTAVTMLYVVSYEWLHLSYHLPETSRIARLWLVRVLRRHHAIHHDPRLMQRWNFNVTLPLWDIVRGTRLSSRSAAPATRLGGDLR